MLKTLQKIEIKSKSYYKNTKAFSLVELIIVIVIISILSTIGFVSYRGYTSTARDAVRKSDADVIKKGLILYISKKGKYIEPGNSTELSDFQGWKVGEITEELSKSLNFKKHLKDPLGANYKYSRSNDGKNYILEIDMEKEDDIVIGNISKSCLDIKKNRQFTGKGLYNIYSTNFRPIEVYCDNRYDETFYREIIDGDMERGDLGVFPTNLLSYTTEENSTDGGSKSIKVVGNPGRIESNHFTYVNPKKFYRISGKFKVKNPTRNPATIWLGFAEYDEDFNFIHSRRVNILQDDNGVPLESEITSPNEEGAKKMFFKCDDSLFDILSSALGRQSAYAISIAYDIKENLADLPTKKFSSPIGYQDSGNLRPLLARESIDNCSLRTESSFPKAELGEKIRFHKSSLTFNYGGAHSASVRGNNWKYFSGLISGESEYGVDNDKFRRGTKFIKPIIIVNYWDHQLPDGTFSYTNPNSITYIDDLKLEVVN